MKVVLVIGLPASGKTHWAERELARLLALGVTAMLLDDPRTQEQLVKGLSHSGHVLFVTDPYLCQPNAREAAYRILGAAGHEVTAVFFENDPDQCLVNATRRPDKSVAKFIERLTPIYEIPANAFVLPVYRERH